MARVCKKRAPARQASGYHRQGRRAQGGGGALQALPTGRHARSAAAPDTPSDTEDADAEDGLLAAIRELSPDEVSEALEAQGVAATDDPTRNASLLVDALMA